MKHLWLLVAASAVCSAAPIVTSSVGCASISNETRVSGSFQTGVEYCAITHGESTAHAWAETMSSWDISGNTVSLAVDAFSTSFGSLDGSHYGSAWASIGLTQVIRTAGAQRQGIVKYSYLLYATPGGTSLQAPFYVDPTNTNSGVIGEQEITIGRLETITAGGQADMDSRYQYFNSRGGVRVSMSFFEADGATPVAVSSVPEPSSMLLGGLGLASVVALRRYRRS